MYVSWCSEKSKKFFVAQLNHHVCCAFFYMLRRLLNRVSSGSYDFRLYLDKMLQCDGFRKDGTWNIEYDFPDGIQHSRFGSRLVIML
jgi:hypothetical protein